MAITVGTDTYISLTDANTYMSSNYLSTSTELATWTALSNADKEILLKNATKKIDRQILRGVKAVETQALEFPRALHEVTNYTNYWIVEESVSQKVKDAQVEEALASVIDGSNANRRAKLQQQGVKSYSLGDLSETFGTTTINTNKLISSVAKELLSYYIAGSVRIC